MDPGGHRQRMQRLRPIVRSVFPALALLYVAWIAPELIGDFRHWRAALPSDPVAAQFWRSAFYSEATSTLIVLAVALLIWLGLRPRKRAAAAPSPQS